MTPGDEIELAKAGIEQLGETGREMIRLAADSSTASEASGLLADEFRFQRFKRQLKIIKKAEKLVNEADLSPSAVPLKTLAPLVAWGGLEDDEDMVSRWANLLASASVAPRGFHVVYPELLRQLEPREARIVDCLFMMEKKGKPVDREVWRLKSGAWRSLRQITRRMEPDGKGRYVEIDARNLQNLDRLALCLLRNADNFMSSGSNPALDTDDSDDSRGYPEIRLTTLGLEFSLACQPPSNLT